MTIASLELESERRTMQGEDMLARLRSHYVTMMNLEAGSTSGADSKGAGPDQIPLSITAALGAVGATKALNP